MILFLLGITVLIVGISFAAFAYFGKGQTENLVKTGNLTFNYNEKESTNQLSLNNAFPITEEEGKGQDNYFEFDVESSTKGAPIYYEIYLTKVDTSTLEEKVVTTYLTSLTGEEEKEVLDPANSKATNIYNKLGSSQVPDQTGGKTLYQELIPEGGSNYKKTFRYRMWVNEAATEVNEEGEWLYNNKIFTVRVNVYASNEEIGKPVKIGLPRMKSYAVVGDDGSISPKSEDFHESNSVVGYSWDIPITNIIVSNKIEIPESATQTWDVSEAGDGSVMAWTVNNGTGTDDDPNYDLIIAGDGGVKAPVNSAWLFGGSTTVKTIDLTYLDTSDVTNMSSFFKAGISMLSGEYFLESALKEIIWGDGFNTSNVTDMEAMFSGCNSLKALSLDHFDTSKVINMKYMFSMPDSSFDFTSSQLTEILLGDKFVTSNVIHTDSMFSGVPSAITVTVKDSIAESFIRERLDNDISVGAGTIIIAA